MTAKEARKTNAVVWAMHKGELVMCRAMGSKEQFAHIYPHDCRTEVSWDTIAHCHETNTPVLCD
jgi:hypothetical protein